MLFYLDPHQTKPALPFLNDVSRYKDVDINSCHTRRLRRIHLGEMDPSMLMAFLIKDENDWKDWQRAIRCFRGRAIIHINDRTPALDSCMYERESAIDEVEALDDCDL